MNYGIPKKNIKYYTEKIGERFYKLRKIGANEDNAIKIIIKEMSPHPSSPDYKAFETTLSRIRNDLRKIKNFEKSCCNK